MELGHRSITSTACLYGIGAESVQGSLEGVRAATIFWRMASLASVVVTDDLGGVSQRSKRSEKWRGWRAWRQASMASRSHFAGFPESRFGSSAVQEEPASQIIARRLTFKEDASCLVLSQHCPPLLSPLHSLAVPHSCPRQPRARRCPPPRRPR